MKSRAVDRPFMARQSINRFPGLDVPYVHDLIGASGRDLRTIGRPRTPQNVFFVAVNVAGKDLDTPVLGGVGPHVPHAQGIVHGVRDQMGALFV